jgi:two-component system, OmpR family, sensor kinase
MRTPSLRRRVVTVGLGVFALLVVVLEVFVALALRQSLDDTLAEVLEARVEVASGLVRTEEPEDLADRLAALGVPARVMLPGGERIEGVPSVPRYEPGPPGPTATVPGPWKTSTVAIPGGGEVEVLVTRAGVDATMRHVVILMAIGTAAALLVALVLLRKAASVAIAPLDHVVEAANRTASGQTGQRLRADDASTELGRLAIAFDAMLDELEDAVTRAQDAEERTRRFVDDAAHQLRTPIATLRAAVEVLLSTEEPDQRDLLMSHLVRETARANRLLNDLLLMARLDAGRPPERHPVDLAALTLDEVERTRTVAPDIEVRYVEPDAPPPPVEADANRLREVVANLLDNARRHADTLVTAHLAADGAGVRLRVDDDGPGVAPEARTLVFERFATLDGMGGSGLGLPIAWAIARAHGGDVTCDDDGFEVWLPVEAPADTGSVAPRGDGGGQVAG